MAAALGGVEMSDKIIVAGGRKFNDYFRVELALKHVIAPGDEIVSGGACGADALGERYAKERNHLLKMFPANWHGLGPSAGHVRKRSESMPVCRKHFE